MGRVRIRENTGFVLNEIFLFTMKSFNPVPMALGNPRELSRRTMPVPTLASQEWGGCEEQAAVGGESGSCSASRLKCKLCCQRSKGGQTVRGSVSGNLGGTQLQVT